MIPELFDIDRPKHLLIVPRPNEESIVRYPERKALEKIYPPGKEFIFAEKRSLHYPANYFSNNRFPRSNYPVIITRRLA